MHINTRKNFRINWTNRLNFCSINSSSDRWSNGCWITTSWQLHGPRGACGSAISRNRKTCWGRQAMAHWVVAVDILIENWWWMITNMHRGIPLGLINMSCVACGINDREMVIVKSKTEKWFVHAVLTVLFKEIVRGRGSKIMLACENSFTIRNAIGGCVQVFKFVQPWRKPTGKVKKVVLCYWSSASLTDRRRKIAEFVSWMLKSCFLKTIANRRIKNSCISLLIACVSLKLGCEDACYSHVDWGLWSYTGRKLFHG